MRLFIWALLFGGLYVVPVLVALCITPRPRRTDRSEGVPFRDRALVFLPIAVYLVLEYLVQTRQGLASWHAQGVLAIPGVLAAVLTSRAHRWSRAAVIIALLAAVALWWSYPGQTTWRFF